MESLIILLIIAIAVFPIISFFVLNGKLNKVSEQIDDLDNKVFSLLQKNTEKELSKKEIFEKAEEKMQETYDKYMPKPVEEEPQVENRYMSMLVEEEEVVSSSSIQIIEEEVPEEILVRSAKIEPEPAPAPKPYVFEPKPEKKKFNYEEFIGGNLFGKIGIIILVVGIGFFVKYAIDKNWINEIFRTILGFAVGFVLLFVAERLRKTYRTFSSLLVGGAFAIFNVTTAIAFRYYELFSQPVAFGILVVATALMSVFAILYDRRELAIIALVGGFLAPFLVSTGSGNYLVLFTYIAILNVSMFGLAMYKKWVELPIISFVFSYLIMLIYTVHSPLPTTIQATHLFIFSTAFYLIFLLPILSILKEKSALLKNQILMSVVVINNFIYMAFGLYFIHRIGLTFKADGLLTLFVALVNLTLILWLRKKNSDHKLLLYTMLGVVLTFASITIPLQLEGHYITLFWASEMVLLLWLYIRSKIKIYEVGALIMVVLTAISLIMDIAKWLDMKNLGIDGQMIFLNGIFITSLFTAFALGLFAVLMHRNKEFFTNFMQASLLKHLYIFHITAIAAIAIAYFSVAFEISRFANDVLLFSWIKLFSISYILALILAFGKKIDVHKYSVLYVLFGIVSVLFFCFLPEVNSTKYIVPLKDIFVPKHITIAIILSWLSAVAVIAVLFFITKLYYKSDNKKQNWFMVFINIAAIFVWVAIVYKFLHQTNIDDSHLAAFSIALGVAGFVQMILGFRLHQKTLRTLSLVSLGIVLAKLIVIDLWKMPSVGKIIVFVSLGIILLVLSFLFQKQKLKKEHNNEYIAE